MSSREKLMFAAQVLCWCVVATALAVVAGLGLQQLAMGKAAALAASLCAGLLIAAGMAIGMRWSLARWG